VKVTKCHVWRTQCRRKTLLRLTTVADRINVVANGGASSPAFEAGGAFSIRESLGNLQEGVSAIWGSQGKTLVIDEQAKLTHEAAIGSVDKKQVDTLMARALKEEKAVHVGVKRMLR